MMTSLREIAKLRSMPASSGVVAANLPEASVTEPSEGQSAPNGLIDDSYVDQIIQGPDNYSDSVDYVDFYVFDNKQDASAWYGQKGVIPTGSTAVSTIDSTGFSQPANCGTYSISASSGASTTGISGCAILDGNVVVTSQTRVQSASAYGSQNLAVILAWVGVMDVDLVDGA
jgi:hypothetical protein